MLRHNLLVIYRNFTRFKGTFFINLIGLSSGLACTLLIYLWVKDELNFDKFHAKDPQLYQVMRTYHGNTGALTSGVTSGILAKALAEELPEVEHATTAGIHMKEERTLSVGDGSVKASGIYADNHFFDVLSFDIVEGDKGRALTDQDGIVITQEMAVKLFGPGNSPVGKMVSFDRQKQYAVVAVCKTPPANSSIQFDFILSQEGLVKSNPGMNDWANNYTASFLILKKGADIGRINAKIKDLIKRNSEDKMNTIFIRQFSDNYLYGENDNGIQTGGRITYVKLFSSIAVFILLIACINFMNLSTAKASRRIKEVGIKKTIGVGRGALIFQYLGESIAIALLSLMIALILVLLLLPQFNQVTGKHLTLAIDGSLALSLLAITLLTGLLAGSYPALYLSGFNPAAVLKGRFNSPAGELWIRKGLVVFQFTLSVVLIVAVLVVYKQIDFIQSKNLGYSRDNIVYFDKEGKAAENVDTFLEEVKTIPGVVNASVTFLELWGTNDFNWEGKKPEEKVEFNFRAVHYDLIETLDIQMAAGRSFSRKFGNDESKIIFNEAAIKAMGLKDPIGKTVQLQGVDNQIVGVVKDFHYQSLHEPIKPLFFKILMPATRKVMVKIKAGQERETIDRLQRFYAQFNPGFPFDYKFLDEDYQALYAAEQRVSVLSRYFAGLAIVISCLGLFGLVTFAAERKRKEIGLRKVFGSSQSGIIYQLSKEFTKLVLVAIVLALPVSYWLTKQWLDGFTYRIPLGVWYFVLAGLLALFIAWLTIVIQAVKAASITPLSCLKDE